MPRDSFIREKFTRERMKYFERFPKDKYQTEVEGWRRLQSDNIEFTIKRLREPDRAGLKAKISQTLLAVIPRVYSDGPCSPVQVAVGSDYQRLAARFWWFG